MKKLLGNSMVAILLSLPITVITMNWVITGSPDKFFLSPHSLAGSVKGINKVDVEFQNRRIFLNVHLQAPMSCKKVIAELGVNPLVVEERTYVPTCSIMSEELIKITYEEENRT